MMVIINGLSNSGKNTFCEFCGDIIYTKSLSAVDVVRKASQLFDLADTKNKVRDRNFMGELLTLVDKYNDHSFCYIEKQYNSFREHVNYALNDEEFIVFVHSRDPKKIDRLKEKFSATTVLFLNPNIDIDPKNIPDKDVMNYEYDYIIENNGTLQELQEKALNFTKEIMNGIDKNQY